MLPSASSSPQSIEDIPDLRQTQVVSDRCEQCPPNTPSIHGKTTRRLAAAGLDMNQRASRRCSGWVELCRWQGHARGETLRSRAYSSAGSEPKRPDQLESSVELAKREARSQMRTPHCIWWMSRAQSSSNTGCPASKINPALHRINNRRDNPAASERGGGRHPGPRMGQRPPNEQNKWSVADDRRGIPADHRPPPERDDDAAMLINSAVVATKGDLPTRKRA